MLMPLTVFIFLISVCSARYRKKSGIVAKVSDFFMSSSGKKKSFEDIELPTNPKVPSWILTPKEEKLIFERWRKKAFQKCDDLMKAYIDCSNSYGPFEAIKQCKQATKLLNECVGEYQKIEYLDIERDILIQEKQEKRKASNGN